MQAPPETMATDEGQYRMQALSALQLPMLAQPELVVPQLEVQAPVAAPEGPTIPERKHCGGCGSVKSSNDFHKSKSRGDGLQSHCKECMARLHTNWRNKRPEVTAPAVSSKVCGGCKKEKPASEFYTDRKRKDGLQCQCKACTAQHHERWRAKKRAELAGHVAAEKTCRACGELKEAEEFCRDTRSPDGLQSRCKACYQIYFSLWSAQKKAQRAPPGGEAAAPTGHKVCATCGVEKALEDFKVSRSKTTDDGRAGSCMDCSKRKVKAPKEPRPPAAEKRKRARKAEPLPAATEQALALAMAPAPDAAADAQPHPQLHMQLLPPAPSFSHLHLQAHSLALALAEAAQMQQSAQLQQSGHLQPMQMHPQLMQPAPELPAAPEEEAVAESAQPQQLLQDAEQQAPKKRRRKPLPVKAKVTAQPDDAGQAGGGESVLGFPKPGEFSGAMAEALAE